MGGKPGPSAAGLAVDAKVQREQGSFLVNRKEEKKAEFAHSASMQ